MKNLDDFLKNNQLNATIINYYNGHEANIGCNSGKKNINPYYLVKDDNNKEYYIIELTNENFTIISLESLSTVKKYKTSWYLGQNGYTVGKIDGKSLYLHQYLLNHYGHGKGQLSIDHINQNKLDNRLENLRIVDQSTQNKNRGKVARHSNAQKLPDLISNVEFPKHVYYYSEILNKDTEQEFFRDYIRIENHPNQKKNISSSKSIKISILDKFREACAIIKELDNNTYQHEKNTIPKFVKLAPSNRTLNKLVFDFDRKHETGRQTIKQTFGEKESKNKNYAEFRLKIKDKYNFDIGEYEFEEEDIVENIEDKQENIKNIEKKKEQTKLIQSLSKMGINNPNYGKKMSDEHVCKISIESSKTKRAKNPNLTNEKIHEIYKLKDKIMQKDVAEKYNMNREMIRRIWNRELLPTDDPEFETNVLNKKTTKNIDHSTSTSLGKRSLTTPQYIEIIMWKQKHNNSELLDGKKITSTKLAIALSEKMKTKITNDIIKNIWNGRTKLFESEFEGNETMSYQNYQTIIGN
jgi:hypothetical protein